MSAFCHVDDAYNQINHNDVDLDKLAREINEQKKQNARDIYRNYRTDQETLSRGVTAYNNLQRDGYDKETNIPNITQGFFSAQGEYADISSIYDNKNETGLLISDIIDEKKQLPKKNIRVKKKRSNLDSNTTNDILKNMISNKYYNNEIEGISKINNNNFSSKSYDSKDNGDLEISSISDSMSELSDISYIHDDESADTLISNPIQYSHSRPLSKMKPKLIKNRQEKDSAITLEDIYREIKLGSNYTQKADETARNVRKKKAKRCIDYDLQSIDSLSSLESGESLLEHINACSRCRDHVIDLIRKNRQNKKSDLMERIVGGMNKTYDDVKNTDIQDNNIKDNNIKEDMDDTNNYGGFALKEILTICLIGFLVIIILDLTINYKH